MEKINIRIKEIREELGLKQTPFAEKLGIPQPYLSALEAGKKDITAKIIGSLVEQFKVSADWLYTGAGRKFITFGYIENFNKSGTSDENASISENASEKLDLTKDKADLGKIASDHVESLREEFAQMSKEEYEKRMSEFMATQKAKLREDWIKDIAKNISYRKSSSYLERQWEKDLEKDLEKEQPELYRIEDSLFFITDTQSVIDDFFNDYNATDVKLYIQEGISYEEAKMRIFKALEPYQKLAHILDELIPIYKKLLREMRRIDPKIGSPLLRNETLE